jgi:predicted O-methyltransferase YrrM
MDFLSMASLPRLYETLRLKKHGLSAHAKIFSHSTMSERLQLFMLAAAVPRGGNALEIGSHLGSSASYLCAGLRKHGGHLYCVDTWQNETMPDGIKNTFEEFKTNIGKFQSMITIVRKRSDELVASDVVLPLDLAFIDGDHSFEAVQKDFRLLADWVRPGGYIAFHDSSRSFPGVGITIGQAMASGKWQLAGSVDTLAWIQRSV